MITRSVLKIYSELLLIDAYRRHYYKQPNGTFIKQKVLKGTFSKNCVKIEELNFLGGHCATLRSHDIRGHGGDVAPLVRRIV